MTRDKLMGIGARVLFVLVKPAALWAAVQLDSDGGGRLAQVYLLGILALSLMGTNAHRSFYKACFEDSELAGPITKARRFNRYLSDLSHQIFCVILILCLSALVFPNAFIEFIWVGLIFALAEKVSDEGIRFTQFKLDNLNLLIWATAKISASGMAVAFAYVLDLDIGLSFPIFLLMFVVALARKEVLLASALLLKGLASGLKSFTKSVFELFRRDYGQIAWVFTTMGLMNIDKWTLQLSGTESLPEYMLVAQLAAAFLVAQTIFVLAPARSKLINKNPNKIPSLQISSYLFATTACLFGCVVFAVRYESSGESLLHFPLFLVGVFVLSAPYLERLYWVAPDRTRIGLDLMIIGLFAFCILMAHAFLGAWPSVSNMLSLLVVFLVVRLICVRALVTNHGAN